MTLLTRDGDSTDHSAAAVTMNWNSLDSYTISEHYLSIPVHESVDNIPLGMPMGSNQSFLTYAHSSC